MLLAIQRCAGWADEAERRKYYSGEDALQLPDVIARLRADLAVRTGAAADEAAVSALELPRLLIRTYLLAGEFPTRDAVLAPPVSSSWLD
jgi:hypothetical protein|eukprot:COSAG06_NODE_1692_length_8705_cov_3.636765_15_plen_90_part_00